MDESNYAAVYHRQNGSTVCIDTSMAAKTPEEREEVMKHLREAIMKIHEETYFRTIREGN